MFTKLIILAVAFQLAACGYIDVDSATIASPSDTTGGDTVSVTFSITFTPTDGAASAITASGNSKRFLIGASLSGDNDGSDTVGMTFVNLTNSQQLVTLTDDSSVTWSDLTFEMDLSSVDCGNGTLYPYMCFGIIPHPSVTWSGVDTSNATICEDFRCKAGADVGIDTLTITNPDDGVLNTGGGQAVEFDVGLTSTSGSDDVVGSQNWKITTFLSSDDSGSDSVASHTATIVSSQLTKDLSAGGSITLSGVAANYDLTSVTCDDFAYLCATIAPHANAYWKFDGSTQDRTVCSAVTCGAGLAQISIFIMLVCVAISRLFDNS